MCRFIRLGSTSLIWKALCEQDLAAVAFVLSAVNIGFHWPVTPLAPLCYDYLLS